MRRLIVVRHGDYGPDKRLTDFGREQIANLAEKLRPFTNGDSVAILTSTAARASESAAILSQAFGVVPEEHELLWSREMIEDVPGVLELIRSRQDAAAVLIVVTHIEYTTFLPPLFGKEELGVSLLEKPILKGQALVIDCVGKSMQRID